MAVTPLENGEVITKADIQDAYDDVRTIVNAVPQGNVGRLSLGQQHVATLTNRDISVGTKPYDSNEVTSPVTVSVATSTPENASNITTSWQRLQDTVTAWRLHGGGAGYPMRPGKVLCWATLRVSEFAKNSDDGRQMAWFALTWRATGDVADQVNLHDTKFCFIDDSGTTSGAVRTTTTTEGTGYRDGPTRTSTYTETSTKLARLSYHNIMLWTIIDKSAEVGSWTLNRLEVKAAVCRGASNAPAEKINCIVEAGTIGFIGLNDR